MNVQIYKLTDRNMYYSPISPHFPFMNLQAYRQEHLLFCCNVVYYYSADDREHIQFYERPPFILTYISYTGRITAWNQLTS